MSQKKYRIGIDVGLKSVGLAAVEIDESGNPLRILNAQSVIHDGGVDPTQQKKALTRRYQSGFARQARRANRTRRKRLAKLDRLLERNGFPIIEPESLTEPFEEWHVRARLADRYNPDDELRMEDVSIAVRHIARHRGWRNPWQRTETLLATPGGSPMYEELKSRVEEHLGEGVEDGLTPAQLVCRVLDAGYGEAPRLRTSTGSSGKPAKDGLMPSRMMQADNKDELQRILSMQRIDDETARELLLCVFESKSPIGAIERRVGQDPLDPARKRAPKSSLSFQRYRIANVITNLRIHEQGADRPLTIDEKRLAFDLLSDTGKKEHTWSEVAEALNVTRRQLRGIGGMTSDGGDRISSRPPRMDSIHALENCSDRGLRKRIADWWDGTTDDEHETLIALISNTVSLESVEEDPGCMAAVEFVTSLSDDELATLDSISLPSGRAAYSAHTLDILTHLMLTTDNDLHEARKHAFNVPDDWRPAEPPVCEPVGDPAVDRVLKIVNRYLLACERRWGTPEAVQIEHVRDGLSSVATANKSKREYENMLSKRTVYRDSLKRMLESAPGVSQIKKSDYIRLEALQRQDAKCLYCGRDIDFHGCEMDHIIPRSGPGSTNTRTNLAAVCRDCNQRKGNTPLATWAAGDGANRGVSLTDAINRVKAFTFPAGTPPAMQKRFRQEVIQRLKRTDADPPIDDRSIESVAWMADELHRRIDWKYNADGERTKVRVFQGRVTAAARKTSRIESDIRLVGGHGKTRFDRRHHAVDAAVIAMMEPSVAKTLMERESLRESQRLSGQVPPWEVPWDEYPTPEDPGYERFSLWHGRMLTLLDLLNDGLDHGRVKVLRPTRLSLGNSAAHADTIQPLLHVTLGSCMPAELIRRASTPQLHRALTGLPDYDPKTGLPEDPNRRITVRGTAYGPDDTIGFFDSAAAQTMVRHGSAAIGTAIHHARIYRFHTPGRKDETRYGMIRVFQTDLLKQRHKDLFAAPLSPHSVSMRYANPDVAAAVMEGRAEYMGWVTIGDTIRIAPKLAGPSCPVAGLDAWVETLPDASPYACSQWTVAGFNSPTQLKLRPLILSPEGLERVGRTTGAAVPEEVDKLIAGRGWVVALNTLAAMNPVCLRFDALGDPRWKSRKHVPLSWDWDEKKQGR